jgi:hypothetical protein
MPRLLGAGVALACAIGVSGARTRALLDFGMKVKVVSGGPAQPCTANATKDWPIDLDNQQCMQLAQVPSAVDVGSCVLRALRAAAAAAARCHPPLLCPRPSR